METALRECIGTAMWKANVNTGLRVEIVPLIQRVLMELFSSKKSKSLIDTQKS